MNIMEVSPPLLLWVTSKVPLLYNHYHFSKMITDTNNIFSTNNEVLTEISQFNNALSNKLISENENFAKRIGFDVDPFESYNELLRQEIDEYKVYDCWYSYSH